MPDFGQFGHFHFLRPWWLLMLLPALLVFLGLRFQESAAWKWRAVIAPHLLEHLVVSPAGRSRIRPLHLLTVLMVISVLALAGPTWRREPPPFTQDTAPLVLALDLSASMLVKDIQPSRLERARQKAADILAGRKGARTALLAYAGSAHMVIPFTDDPGAIELYLSSLEPALMPVPGKDTARALALAQQLLATEETPGTILFLTDGVEEVSRPALVEYGQTQRDQLAFLAVATEQGGPIPAVGGDGLDGAAGVSRLDRAGLESLAADCGGYLTLVTVDDTDVRRLDGGMARHLSDVQQEDQQGRWRDEGYWLLIPVALLTLLWFRRGWTIQWEAS
jgi:Ca-activated chloride channel family protein